MTKLLSIEIFICSVAGKFKSRPQLNDNELPILSLTNTVQYQSRIASWSMYFYCFSALFSAMSMGTVIGWSSTAFNSMKMDYSVPRIRPDEPIDINYMTWMGSCMTLGALFGSLFSGIIIDHFGRRIILRTLAIPFTIGWLIISFAQSFLTIIFGRVITGICVGIIASTVPGYVANIVTPNRRGFLGTCFQLLCSIGALSAACFGTIFSWNRLSLISIIPVIISSIGMCFAPESPIRLVQRNQSKAALQSLKRLRSNGSDIMAELIELENRIKSSRQLHVKSSIKSLFKRPDVYHPLIIGVMLQFFQQFSGINAIMFYLVSIFIDSGSNIDPQLASIVVNFALFISCLFSGLSMDFFGRRLWLFISGSGMFMTMLMMALHYHCNLNDKTSSTPLICLIIFSVSFACGYGSIPWMIVSEITPPEAAGLVGSFSAATNWLCAFIITKEFEDLIYLLGKEGLYFLFSLFSLISILFVMFFVPETKRKTLEDLQNHFLNNY
ncbi:trehalose transporter 1-like protein [Dermatophagoides pteronyssinus]|uniref:trehalose transporter 1-like protein n=1 Tax=Dermatophagoides pteronyssinus TaxID=6956 RepID=UPI003F669E66